MDAVPQDFSDCLDACVTLNRSLALLVGKRLRSANELGNIAGSFDSLEARRKLDSVNQFMSERCKKHAANLRADYLAATLRGLGRGDERWNSEVAALEKYLPEEELTRIRDRAHETLRRLVKSHGHNVETSLNFPRVIESVLESLPVGRILELSGDPSDRPNPRFNQLGRSEKEARGKLIAIVRKRLEVSIILLGNACQKGQTTFQISFASAAGLYDTDRWIPRYV